MLLTNKHANVKPGSELTLSTLAPRHVARTLVIALPHVTLADTGHTDVLRRQEAVGVQSRTKRTSASRRSLSSLGHLNCSLLLRKRQQQVGGRDASNARSAHPAAPFMRKDRRLLFSTRCSPDVSTLARRCKALVPPRAKPHLTEPMAMRPPQVLGRGATCGTKHPRAFQWFQCGGAPLINFAGLTPLRKLEIVHRRLRRLRVALRTSGLAMDIRLSARRIAYASYLAMSLNPRICVAEACVHEIPTRELLLWQRPLACKVRF